MVIKNRREEAFTKRVNEIIKANLSNERFGVSELAKAMNMSRNSLHRKLKSATDQSVSQFIRIARLNKALELLKNESLTVAEAAYMTGFGSATYFSKCFRDYFGYPPVEVTKRSFDGTDLDDIKEKNISEVSWNLMHHFPIQTTSFIGRENEIRIIIDMIHKHRIVTLTGTGGCGKTRLACEVAKQLVKNYPDGIWFVDLAPVETVDLVAKQLMTTLGLTEIPDGDMMKILVESIRNKKLLILLDNCEHLLITCAEITRRLIESVPGISLVVTSREALNIQGEIVWIVPSLTLTDPTTETNLGVAEWSEAVRLFSDRARLKNPEFKLDEENVSTVATLCHKVDGLPLAIELVASRARHMDTVTMLERLSESFDKIYSLDPVITPRHRSIQTTIEWSYNLLTEDEKALFRRLTVFAGGFDLEAVEKVCSNESLRKENILDLLSRLVDTCMIQTSYSTTFLMRYRMLETLRQYAKRLIIENNEADETSERHLEYYTWMAEKAFQERLKSQLKWIDKLELEHDNLISALNWSDINSPETFVRLSGALGWFWRLHSHLVMGCNFLERALVKNTARKEYYARVLYGLGLLLSVTEDVSKAIDLLNESLNLWRQVKNVEEEAAVLRDLIFPYQSVGDLESSQACGKKCMELAKQTRNMELINHCLTYVCFNFITAKNFDQAKPMIKELLDTSKLLNQPDGIVVARHYLGDCALADEDFKEAERRYALSIETARKYGNTLQSVNDVLGVAFAVSGQSRWAKSLRLGSAANEKARLFGVSLKGLAGFWDEWIDTYIEGAKQVVGEELAKQYEEEGIAMGFEKAVEYALDFNKD